MLFAFCILKVSPSLKKTHFHSNRYITESEEQELSNKIVSKVSTLISSLLFNNKDQLDGITMFHYIIPT